MKKTKKLIKKGDKLTMLFRCAGMVSKEIVKVHSIDGDVVTITDTWHPDNGDDEQNGKFNIKNGKCLNDNTAFGSSRSLEI